MDRKDRTGVYVVGFVERTYKVTEVGESKRCEEEVQSYLSVCGSAD